MNITTEDVHEGSSYLINKKRTRFSELDSMRK